MRGALIVGGKDLPIDCVVVRDWPTYQFKVARKRQETRTITLHYTAGVNPPQKMFRKLQSDGLSVHLAVAYDGTVHQLADIDRRCSHAGKVEDTNRDGLQHSGNEYSVGIEVVCPGHNLTPAQRKRSDVTAGPARWQILREEVHGETMPTAMFTAAQTASVLELVRVLCAHYGLPLQVPMVDGHVLTTTMHEDDYAQFRGVAPHYALRHGKRDPSPAIMRTIAALPLAGVSQGPSRPPEGQAE